MEMSSTVQGRQGVASGTAEKPGKAGGEAEPLFSEIRPDPTFLGVCTVLQMVMIDEGHDAVIDRHAWNDKPYAEVRGEIGTVVEEHYSSMQCWEKETVAT